MPTQHPRLMAPGRIGSLELRNRILMCPMGDNQASDGGYVSDQQIAYFEARAKGGAGLLLVLTGGFGMLARFKDMGLDASFGTWLWVKLGVWLTLGVAVVVPKRLPKATIWLWAALPLLGLLAAAAAQSKW